MMYRDDTVTDGFILLRQILHNIIIFDIKQFQQENVNIWGHCEELWKDI